ncbi:unnamed protein product [Calypogeia fissa]
MEAIRAGARAAATGSVVAVVDSGVASSSSSSSSARAPSARAFLSRRPLSCPGVSSSPSGAVAVSSFYYNALAAKVPGAESVSKGHRGVVTMRSETAAGGYATALAELAQSTDELEAIHKDIESFGDVLKNPEIYEFLVSPVVLDEKKKSILKNLADDAKFNQFTLNFFNVLVDKKRFGLINDVVKEFSTIYFELTDTQLATVASAVKIEKAQLALIAKKIQTLSGAKNVRIKNVIDPSLIAGFIVKYGKDGSCFVDMSVKGQLDRLAQQFAYAEKVGAI